MIDLMENTLKQINKMTISNRGTKNSNCTYISNKFAEDKNTFRIRKEKMFRKEKKGYNVKFP